MHSLSATAEFCVSFAVWLECVVLFLYADGSISKGAIYMLGVTSYEEARNRKNLTSSKSANDGITNADQRDKAEVCVYLYRCSDVVLRLHDDH